MEENRLKIPKGFRVSGALPLISLLAVFLAIWDFPQGYAWLAIGIFMLLFGHRTWTGFSFTMIQSRNESLKDIKE